MSSLARRLTGPIALALLLSACGDDGTVTKAGSSPTSAARRDGGGGSDVELSDEFCRQLDAAAPSDALVDAAPAAYRDAVTALVAFASVMDTSGSEDAPDATALRAVADSLAADGIAAGLRDLGAAAVDQCPDSEGATFLPSFATAAVFVGAEASDDYCAALRTALAESGDDADFAALEAVAPDAHRDGIATLASAMDRDEPPEGETAATVAGVFFGLGLYGEVRCGISDAFSTMAFAGAFIGSAGDGGSGIGYDDSADAEAEPPAADPGAANAAVPGGAAVTFEARTIGLEDEGTYHVSAVVPAGWEESDSFGLTYEPPSGSDLSIFTELRFDTGCDGTCAPTDWEARLRGTDGYLTSAIGDSTITLDRAVQGSDGAVVTTEGEDGSVDAYVLRWDDERSKYFLCSASLEAEQADWLPAFVAACESSRPGWITVT